MWRHTLTSSLPPPWHTKGTLIIEKFAWRYSPGAATIPNFRGSCHATGSLLLGGSRDRPGILAWTTRGDFVQDQQILKLVFRKELLAIFVCCRWSSWNGETVKWRRRSVVTINKYFIEFCVLGVAFLILNGGKKGVGGENFLGLLSRVGEYFIVHCQWRISKAF